jgi:hypothetical protein
VQVHVVMRWCMWSRTWVMRPSVLAGRTGMFLAQVSQAPSRLQIKRQVQQCAKLP